MPTFEDLFTLVLDVFIHSSNSLSKVLISLSDDLFIYTGVSTSCEYSSVFGFTLTAFDTQEDKINTEQKKGNLKLFNDQRINLKKNHKIRHHMIALTAIDLIKFFTRACIF